MKRSLMLLLLAASLVRPSASRAGVDVNINVGAPPPPQVFFEREPEVLLVPRTKVYYVPKISEYDMFRVGPYWYVNREGYWYRAKKYAGPFTFVEVHRVPHEIIVLPSEYHHHPVHPHGGPPGQRKKGASHGHHGKKSHGHKN